MAKVVRIPRTESPPEEPPSGPGNNIQAHTRSKRFFLLGFLLVPLGVWGFFTGVLAEEPSFSLTGAAELLLSAILGLTVLIGFYVTLGRTPIDLSLAEGGTLVARMGQGQVKRIRFETPLRWSRLERYRPSPLSNTVSELVQLDLPQGKSIRWILEEGLLQRVIGDRAGEPSSEGPRVRPPPS